MNREDKKRVKTYVSPKSLIYTGEHQGVSTQITHYQYDQESCTITDGFAPIQNKKHYIQVIGLSDVEKIQSIKDEYKISPLILEDVFNVHQRNKLELDARYLFGAFHVQYLDDDGIGEDYLSVILTPDTVITFHETTPVYLHSLTDIVKSDKELRRHGSDYLFYLILDMITDNHLDVFDFLEEKIDRFEEEILESKKIDQDDFYLVRKQILKLKNCVSPLLDELSETLKYDNQLFSPETRGYYIDLTDHLRRLDSQLSTTREEIRHLLDLLMNNQSNKMNQIITTLTLFSTIFIPLSFLAGFFGMNFVHFEILHYEHAVMLFVLVCILLAGFMLWFFKKKKWF